jgi:ferrous iron transport protein B
MELKIGDHTEALSNKGRVGFENFGINVAKDQFVIALAGNPNVGKSTVFNSLTGLHQHTGNWPGKTVDNAQGTFTYRGKQFLLVDLPGTYSILAHSVEEEIARDFICFGQPDVTVVVLDATSLERNLNLALQIMEITSRIVVCVNLMDEARKKRITIDFPTLEKELGVPVVATAARNGEGLDKLQQAIFKIAVEKQPTEPKQIVYSDEVEKIIRILQGKIEEVGMAEIINPRWLALRLLDSDPTFVESIGRYLNLYKRNQMIHAKGERVAL